MINYRQFNEGKKNKRDARRSYHDDDLKDIKKDIKRGMSMDFSDNFYFILKKIASKNNVIAKELIELSNKIDDRFECSYIDITRHYDTLSYLSSSHKDIPEEEKYESNKRQFSKVYKVIKNIFGSKYTKNEVTKFVSMFKNIYIEGPDNKTDNSVDKNVKLEIFEIVKKITEDTKSNKLKWTKEYNSLHLKRYQCIVDLTAKKKLKFELFIFAENDKIKNTFLSINLLDDSTGKSKNDKNKWLTSIYYNDLKDFMPVFFDKIDVE